MAKKLTNGFLDWRKINDSLPVDIIHVTCHQAFPQPLVFVMTR